MKIITEEEMAIYADGERSEEGFPKKHIHLFDEDIGRSIEETKAMFDSPVEVQKEMAAKIKAFLDYQMMSEMRTDGRLSNSTRNWVRDFMGMSKDIHVQLYGTKSTNLKLDANTISHGDIAKKLRELKGEK